MVRALVHATVKDFDVWYKAFLDMRSTTTPQGMVGTPEVFQDERDLHRVFILSQWNTADDARRFYDSSTIRDAQKRSGVRGNLEITYLREVQPVTA